MRIKVLHVLGGLSIGGAETLFVNILKTIDLNKYRFDVVIHRSNLDEYREIVEKYHCNIYVCPTFNFFNIISYKKWWMRFFKEHNVYNIVHGHMTSVAAIYLKIAKSFGIKTISHIHSASYGSGIKSLLKTFIGKKVNKYADKKIGCSKEACQFLYGDDGNAIILKNGIDVKGFKFNQEKRKLIRNKIGIGDNELLVGTVGRIVPIKNPYFILRLIESNADAYKFLWVGNGLEKKNIVRMANDLKISNKIIFIDSTFDASSYYSSMDIFIFPSVKEGLGISLIEAQSSGLPCIISKGIPDSAIVTDLVNVIDADIGMIGNWNKQIKDIVVDSNNRTKFNQIIFKSGYDIADVTSSLIEIYNSLVVK